MIITIKQAAILYSGVIYAGWRHGQIGHEMLLNGICKRPYPGGDSQGFVTSNGMFVNREDAMNIAKAAGQIDTNKESTLLFSEDLWTPTGDKANYQTKETQ